MLIFEYYNGQLERMFTDRDTEFVDRMCWHLDNPVTDMWTYYTEDNTPILHWEKDGRTYGKSNKESERNKSAMEHRHFSVVDNKTLYFDKNGEEIKAGMTLRHDDGEENEVFECGDEYGSENLGFSATNPEFLKYHPDWPTEYYPLHQFDLSKWEIVKETA